MVNITTGKQESNYRDYPPEVYKYLFDVEPKHFWFRGRNMIIDSVVKDVVGEVDKKTLLEVGCGTGFVLSYLEKLGFMVTGLDMHRESIRFARKRTKAPLLCTRLEEISTKKRFDVVGAFEVLEHVERQNEFLEKCGKFIKKNGRIMLTVPARKELWSKIDGFSGHKRRYDKTNLSRTLEKCGFEVEKIKYFGFFLLLPQWALRKYQDMKMDGVDRKNVLAFFKQTIKPPPFLINEVFRLLFYLESKLIRHISFPVGTLLIVTARKSKGELK